MSRFETLGQREPSDGARRSLTKTIAANTAVANVTTRWTNPRSVEHGLFDVFAVTIVETNAAKHAATSGAKSGTADGLLIQRFLTALVARRSILAVHFVAYAVANVADHHRSHILRHDDVLIRIETPTPRIRTARADLDKFFFGFGLIVVVVIDRSFGSG